MKHVALAAHGMTKASPENRADRAISILFVLIIHALLIFALLRPMVRPQTTALLETQLSEMVINTARPPEPRTRKDAHKPAPVRAAAHHASQNLAPSEPLVPIVPMPAPDISGIGQALIDCVPENFRNLDDAQRARCRKLGAFSSYDHSDMDYTDHSDKVPGAKQWERELARKKAPLLLPCGNSKALDPVYTGACIIANVANGFTFKEQYENQPTYSDQSEKK